MANPRILFRIFFILNSISVVAFILLVVLKKGKQYVRTYEVIIFTPCFSFPFVLDTIDMLGVMESSTNGRPYPCNYTPLFWAPFFVNETISFLMISYKAWENRKTGDPCQKGLGNTIVTHNIVYYFM